MGSQKINYGIGQLAQFKESDAKCIFFVRGSLMVAPAFSRAMIMPWTVPLLISRLFASSVIPNPCSGLERSFSI